MAEILSTLAPDLSGDYLSDLMPDDMDDMPDDDISFNASI